MKNSSLITAFKNVYANYNYIILSLIVAIVLTSINIIAPNYGVYLSLKSLKASFIIFFGTFSILPGYAINLLIIASILSGIFVSFLVYQIRAISHLTSAVGSSGTILGLLAPSCASCGIGLAALFGLSGFLSSLPLKGIEISVLGIVLLIVAISTISKRIANKTCEVKLKTKKNE